MPFRRCSSLDTLEKVFDSGDTVTVEKLIELKIVDKTKSKNGIKILASGSISKSLTVDSKILLSKTAKDAIIKAGGKIVE